MGRRIDMDMDSLIEQIVEDMDFDTLCTWAKTFKLSNLDKPWSDDDWLDKENKLRVDVAEAMMEAVK